ncbi:MAG: Tm-1-like ATP-binding domain-containing protein, partial [Silicimonas sp.]|nr:Tm-1-like ATP-binding domain-containing protein [Silicimonas sp.]
FLIPEGGVSAIDAPGQPFHNPEALAALTHRLNTDVIPTQYRRVISVPHNLNTPEFADAALAAFREIT